MDEVCAVKQRSAIIVGVLRKAANENITSQMIAQLNDMAYRGIKKQSKQKKLDERAIKNESYFTKLEN